MHLLKRLFAFVLNLLFVITANYVSILTVGVWLLYFWPNSGFHTVPDWFWILTSANSLILLGFLKIVRNNWGLEVVEKFWDLIPQTPK